MRAQDHRDAAERLQRQQDALGIHRMTFELGGLLGRHRRDGRVDQRLVQRELAKVAEQTGEVHVPLLIFREPEGLRRRVRELGDLAHADRVARASLDQAREHLDGRDETVVHFPMCPLEQLGGPSELGRTLLDLLLERRVQRRELLRLPRRELAQALTLGAQRGKVSGRRSRVTRGSRVCGCGWHRNAR